MYKKILIYLKLIAGYRGLRVTLAAKSRTTSEILASKIDSLKNIFTTKNTSHMTKITPPKNSKQEKGHPHEEKSPHKRRKRPPT